MTEDVKYEYIFGTVEEQKQVMPTIMKREETRKYMKTHLSPGEVCSPDLCKFSFILDYASDNNL